MAPLNADQQKAFEAIIDFINNPNEHQFRISGGAGRGKTFLIDHIVNSIMMYKKKDIRIDDIKITATTNKAAAVLEHSLTDKHYEPITIHKLLGLTLYQDFSTGKEIIKSTRASNSINHELIILDEASMIDSNLKFYIDKYIQRTCKIIYVGDKNQINPVNEDISPVYSCDMPEAMLEIPVRNANQPALVDLCKQAVHMVETGEFFKFQHIPGVINLVNGPQLQGVIQRLYVRPTIDHKIIGYTNERAIAYNSYIKEMHGHNNIYNVGEFVNNNSTIDKLFYTDQTLEITHVGKPYTKANFDLVKVTLKDPMTLVEITAPCFVDPSDRGQWLKEFSKKKDWEKYFAIKNNIPDLRSMSAITSHKSQGSTYHSVIVDLNDIGTCWNKKQTARMLYVAVSRAKDCLYIRGELPNRYY